MTGKVPIAKIPTSDSTGRPRDRFTDSLVTSVNQSIFDLQHRGRKMQVKEFYITTPSQWLQIDQTGDWAGKGGHVYLMKHYDGSVQINGFITGGTSPSSPFTLPQNCRPQRNLVFWTSGGSISCNASNGQAFASSAGTHNFSIRFMPSNNRPQPLSCFPINVSTGFNQQPEAVMAVRLIPDKQYLHQRTSPTAQSECIALGVSWRYIRASNGPAVQILDIPGLEYGTKQKVKLFVYGRE